MEHTELASMGGKARAKSLTKRRRKEIARMGGKAGGRGRKKAPVKKAAA
jgi:general stress protein YciG